MKKQRKKEKLEEIWDTVQYITQQNLTNNMIEHNTNLVKFVADECKSLMSYIHKEKSASYVFGNTLGMIIGLLAGFVIGIISVVCHII